MSHKLTPQQTMAMKRQFSVASLQQYLERVPFNKSESQYEFVVVV